MRRRRFRRWIGVISLFLTAAMLMERAAAGQPVDPESPMFSTQAMESAVVSEVSPEQVRAQFARSGVAQGPTMVLADGRLWTPIISRYTPGNGREYLCGSLPDNRKGCIDTADGVLYDATGTYNPEQWTFATADLLALWGFTFADWVIFIIAYIVILVLILMVLGLIFIIKNTKPGRGRPSQVELGMYLGGAVPVWDTARGLFYGEPELRYAMNNGMWITDPNYRGAKWYAPLTSDAQAVGLLPGLVQP